MGYRGERRKRVRLYGTKVRGIDLADNLDPEFMSQERKLEVCKILLQILRSCVLAYLASRK